MLSEANPRSALASVEFGDPGIEGGLPRARTSTARNAAAARLPGRAGTVSAAAPWTGRRAGTRSSRARLAARNNERLIALLVLSDAASPPCGCASAAAYTTPEVRKKRNFRLRMALAEAPFRRSRLKLPRASSWSGVQPTEQPLPIDPRSDVRHKSGCVRGDATPGLGNGQCRIGAASLSPREEVAGRTHNAATRTGQSPARGRQ